MNYPMRLLQFTKAEMRLVAGEEKGRVFTSVSIKRWDLLAYVLSYFEHVVECCLTHDFYSL